MLSTLCFETYSVENIFLSSCKELACCPLIAKCVSLLKAVTFFHHKYLKQPNESLFHKYPVSWRVVDENVWV